MDSSRAGLVLVSVLLLLGIATWLVVSDDGPASPIEDAPELEMAQAEEEAETDSVAREADLEGRTSSPEEEESGAAPEIRERRRESNPSFSPLVGDGGPGSPEEVYQDPDQAREELMSELKGAGFIPPATSDSTKREAPPSYFDSFEVRDARSDEPLYGGQVLLMSHGTHLSSDLADPNRMIDRLKPIDHSGVNEEGIYELPNSDGGSVVVLADGYVPVSFWLSAGRSPREVVWLHPEEVFGRRLIRVEVLDRNGRLWSGVEVTAIPQEGRGTSPRRYGSGPLSFADQVTVATDSKGVAHLPLRASAYRFEVEGRSEDGWKTPAIQWPDLFAESRRLRIGPAKRSLTFELRVTDGTDQRVPDQNVTLAALVPHYWSGVELTKPSRRRSDESGRASWTGLPAGDYELQLATPGYDSWRTRGRDRIYGMTVPELGDDGPGLITMDSGRTREVLIVGESVIRGRVLANWGGDRTNYDRVQISGTRRGSFSVPIRSTDGAFEIPDVLPGKYIIQASAGPSSRSGRGVLSSRSYVSKPLEIEVRPGRDLNNVELSVTLGTTMKVLVEGPNGEVLPNAECFWMASWGPVRIDRWFTGFRGMEFRAKSSPLYPVILFAKAPGWRVATMEYDPSDPTTLRHVTLQLNRRE